MFKLVVLSVALAVASASPSGILGGLATPWNAAIAAPLVAPVVASPLAAVAPISTYNYRGPLSLAPGQPATILAADGRPLDTLSVNLDRAVHATAKAVEAHGHWLGKRSIVGAPLVAAPWAGAALAAPAVAVAHSSRIDIPAAGVIGAPIGLAAAAPVGPLGLGLGGPIGLAAAAPIGPLGLGIGARLGHPW